jgi:hypothetical protein
MPRRPISCPKAVFGIRHVVADTPFRWDLMEGAKGVQLADTGLQSWKQRRWVDIQPLM